MCNRIVVHLLRRAALVDVKHERANHLGPMFSLCHVDNRAAVVAAAPVVQHSGCLHFIGIAMAEELNLGRATAEIFNRGIEYPEADMLRSTRPTERGIVELVCREVVLI